MSSSSQNSEIEMDLTVELVEGVIDAVSPITILDDAPVEEPTPASPEARLVLPQEPLAEIPVPPEAPLYDATHFNATAIITALERTGIRIQERGRQNLDVLIGMGFSNDLISRSIVSVEDYNDIGMLVNQCLYYDNLGKVPPELLQDVPLDRATFVGSRVTSQRHHMTYKVMEFDRENACVFLVPIIYNRFQWGRGTNRAFWAPMNSHDIEFDSVVHMRPYEIRTEENCNWYSLPPYTVSTRCIDPTLRGKDWEDMKRFMHEQSHRTGIFHDLYVMEQTTGPYATISYPVYPEYHTNESFRRFKDSILQHMFCICDVHNLPIRDLRRIIDENDRDAAEAMGHGILELYNQQINYRNSYIEKHEDWKRRCIPLIRLNVDFDWSQNLATINIDVCDKSRHMFKVSVPQRIAFADVIGRALSPRLFLNDHTFNNGGQSGRILTSTLATKVTTKSKFKEMPKMSKESISKLQPQQRKVFQFLVDRAVANTKFGWSKLIMDQKQILFHSSGLIRFTSVGEDIKPYIATHAPCGGIAVLPPKSGKSTLAGMFAMEMATRMHRKYGRTHKALIVINKCQKGFIEILQKVVDENKFKIIRWRSSENHVDDLSYRNITSMRFRGCIVVATITQVKSDHRIRHINWDSIALDDAHRYASCQSAAGMLHACNLLRKPVCIFTQNKEWKVKEFNFYMHMINMPGFHFESMTYARSICNSMWNRDTYIVNFRKSILKKFCIFDTKTVQKEDAGLPHVSVKLVERNNKAMIDSLHKNQELSGKKSSAVSYVMHAAATDPSIVPVHCFSTIKPEILNGVRVYKQRLADACGSIGDSTESSKATKRKLKEIVGNDNASDENKCSICFEKIEKAMLLDCEHVFCTDCIRTNTRVSRKCPLCRKKILTMKEIDQECQETTQYEGHIVEKKLLEKWKVMKESSDSPKVEELKTIALKNKCVAFYSRFSKICTAVSDRLRKDERFKIFNLTSYGSAKRSLHWLKRNNDGKNNIVLVMFPSLRDFPVSISACKVVVANESFLTMDESKQVVSRFVEYDEAPPKIIILKTKGTIDTAGCFFRNNTESGLVSDFFCNARNSQPRLIRTNENADIVTVHI